MSVVKSFLLRPVAAAADLLVAPSFGRVGFHLRAATWPAAALAVDLKGRDIAVTGANSGIGLATSEALARLGATVHMLCRDAARGAEAVRGVQRDVPGARVVQHVVDMESLTSIRAFAASWVARGGAALHGLVHNAGAMFDHRVLDKDGIERTFALHVLGPFALTRALAPALRSGRGRVVFVSSGGMYTNGLDIHDLQSWRERFDGVKAYARAKRMQVILAERFHRELSPDGVHVSAMHPGWVDTAALAQALPRFRRWTSPLLRDAKQGADTVIWLIASPEAADAGGRFWFDRLPRRTHLPGARTHSTPAEVDALWEECLRMERIGMEKGEAP